jgi:hypothetical protein
MPNTATRHLNNSLLKLRLDGDVKPLQFDHIDAHRTSEGVTKVVISKRLPKQKFDDQMNVSGRFNSVATIEFSTLNEFVVFAKAIADIADDLAKA